MLNKPLFTTLALLSASLFGQTAPSSFDAASIKLSSLDAVGGGYHLGPGGRITVRSFTLKNLIMLAWHVQDYQVIGGPSWLDELRYDVDAVGGGDPDGEELRDRLQNLLVERFQLIVLHETRQLVEYKLVVANGDRRLGSKLVAVNPGSCNPTAEFSTPVTSDEPACGLKQRFVKQQNGGRLMQVQGFGVTMDLLARFLGNILDRHVDNETSLRGAFDIIFEYAPDTASVAGMGQENDAVADGPSFFSALRDDLKLRLASGKGPVPVIAINRATTPSEN